MKSVIQTRMVGNFAEIVAVTHITENKKIKAALNLLQALPVVDEISSVLRVENAGFEVNWFVFGKVCDGQSTWNYC